MKEIRKDVAEANEIAKFMNKDIVFTDYYISKFEDEGGMFGQQNSAMDPEAHDEVQIKVENFECGSVNIWSCEKF